MAVPKEKKYTADEFFNIIPENNRKYELFDGKIIMQAMPSIEHQLIGANLFSKFKEFIKKRNGKCVPLPPIDVQLDLFNSVVPDFMVVCDPSKLDDKRCYGVPDFIAEIVSSNRSDDFVKKFALYLEYGVREYWIIDPKYKKTVVYFFDKNEIPEIYTFDKPIPVRIFNGELEINIDELL